MQKNQVRWQCRRGMLELDLILLQFFDNCFESMTQVDQQLFVRFLQEPDQTLYRWLLGEDQPEDVELASLVQTIRRLTC